MDVRGCVQRTRTSHQCGTPPDEHASDCCTACCAPENNVHIVACAGLLIHAHPLGYALIGHLTWNGNARRNRHSAANRSRHGRHCRFSSTCPTAIVSRWDLTRTRRIRRTWFWRPWWFLHPVRAQPFTRAKVAGHEDKMTSQSSYLTA